MTDRLLQIALNETRALQREIQGLKNQAAAQDRRIRILEAKVTDGNGQVTDTPSPVTDAVTDVTDTVTDDVQYPVWVEGTKGRGIQYKLSDGTVLNCGKLKAVKAEAALHGNAA